MPRSLIFDNVCIAFVVLHCIKGSLTHVNFCWFVSFSLREPQLQIPDELSCCDLKQNPFTSLSCFADRMEIRSLAASNDCKIVYLQVFVAACCLDAAIQCDSDRRLYTTIPSFAQFSHVSYIIMPYNLLIFRAYMNFLCWFLRLFYRALVGHILIRDLCFWVWNSAQQTPMLPFLRHKPHTFSDNGVTCDALYVQYTQAIAVMFFSLNGYDKNSIHTYGILTGMVNAGVSLGSFTGPIFGGIMVERFNYDVLTSTLGFIFMAMVS